MWQTHASRQRPTLELVVFPQQGKTVRTNVEGDVELHVQLLSSILPFSDQLYFRLNLVFLFEDLFYLSSSCSICLLQFFSLLHSSMAVKNNCPNWTFSQHQNRFFFICCFLVQFFFLFSKFFCCCVSEVRAEHRTLSLLVLFGLEKYPYKGSSNSVPCRTLRTFYNQLKC